MVGFAATFVWFSWQGFEQEKAEFAEGVVKDIFCCLCSLLLNMFCFRPQAAGMRAVVMRPCLTSRLNSVPPNRPVWTKSGQDLEDYELCPQK